MLRRVILTSLTTCLFALVCYFGQPSNAQAQITTYKSPANGSAYSWTGPYLGVSLGEHWTNANFTAVSIGGAPPPFAPTSRLVEIPTFRVGGYLGYNWQLAPTWLIGVEGDFAWANSSVTKPGVVGGTPAPVAGDSTKSEVFWDSSLRGRAGFLVTPTWLLYGTSGVAWQKIAATTTCSAATCPAIGGGAQTDSRIITGWTVGGGIEGIVWTNWILRAEYRFSDYPTWRYTYFSGAAASVNDSKIQTHIASVGLAYKF